jgi:hypothetical protein
MAQLYLQRFEYLGSSKADFDQAWGVALQAFAKAGNWGGVEAGVRHVKSYGTGWGGYALVEVDDPAAFARYQAFHNENYGHVARNTFEPLFDLDAAMAEKVGQIGR